MSSSAPYISSAAPTQSLLHHRSYRPRASGPSNFLRANSRRPRHTRLTCEGHVCTCVQAAGCHGRGKHECAGQSNKCSCTLARELAWASGTLTCPALSSCASAAATREVTQDLGGLMPMSTTP